MKIALVNGQDADFTDALNDLKIEYDLKSIKDLEEDKLSNYDILMVLAENYQFPNIISPASIQKIDEWVKSGKGLYCEYTFLDSSDKVVMPVKLKKERAFIHNNQHLASREFKQKDIFDPRECNVVPIDCPSEQMLIGIGTISGTHTVRHFITEKIYPGLVLLYPEHLNVIYATFPLSKYTSKYFTPHFKWNKLVKGIIRAISNGKIDENLNIQSRNQFAPMYSPEAVFIDRKKVYLDTVKRGIEWFFKAGVLLPGNNGSLGAAEFIYYLDKFGNPLLNTAVRGDCSVETAAMFNLYGKVTLNPLYEQIGRSIYKYLVENGYQFQDKNSPGYGFWYYGYGENTGAATHHIFADDTSWCIICSLWMYLQTKEIDYLKRGLITTEAFADTQNYEGLRAAVFTNKDLDKYGRDYFRNKQEPQRFPGHYSPHWDGLALGAYMWAYAVSRDPVYLDIAERGIRNLINNFDEGNPLSLTVTRTSETSYMLQPLALLYYFTGKEEYKVELRKYAEFLASLQDITGALEEHDNPRKDLYDFEDVATIHDNHEGISDQMYTCSWAVMNLFFAWKATGDEFYLDMFHKLADYLVKIQIKSPNPMYNGGWMRGFDFRNWEYYATNAETGWGAYVIESGWDVAPICTALLMYVLDDPLFMLHAEYTDSIANISKEVREDKTNLYDFPNGG